MGEPDRGRRLGWALLAEATAVEHETAGPPGTASSGLAQGEDKPAQQGGRVEVRFVAGESYAVSIRGHEMLTGQPAGAGGHDAAATPTELLVASLASCVAYYAGRYLTRHALCRTGLRVTAEFDMSAGRPPRVAAVRLRVLVPPGLPGRRRAALHAVVSHCTVHSSLTRPPRVAIEIT